MGVGLTLREFDEIQKDIPVVAKFKPSSKYNISDYHKAGGVGATLMAINGISTSTRSSRWAARSASTSTTSTAA